MLFSRYTNLAIIISLIIVVSLALQNLSNSGYGRLADRPHVKLYDLTNPLEPVERFSPIKCYPTIVFYKHNTTVCTHDTDVQVSLWIARNGYWEYEIMDRMLKVVSENPDWLVLDVGANIGVFTLFPAQMGSKVVAVEPYAENVWRIHKSSHIGKTQNSITLIQNAISNKRNEWKELSANPQNQGGQGLLESRHKVITKDKVNASNTFMVETIVFDDIVDYLPKKDDGSDYKRAVLKIDIEGFESLAFQHATRLFSVLDIRVIFMEWELLKNVTDFKPYTEHMIQFFQKQGFLAYDVDKQLDVKEYMKWPWNVEWRKN